MCGKIPTFVDHRQNKTSNNHYNKKKNIKGDNRNKVPLITIMNMKQNLHVCTAPPATCRTMIRGTTRIETRPTQNRIERLQIKKHGPNTTPYNHRYSCLPHYYIIHFFIFNLLCKYLYVLFFQSQIIEMNCKYIVKYFYKLFELYKCLYFKINSNKLLKKNSKSNYNRPSKVNLFYDSFSLNREI